MKKAITIAALFVCLSSFATAGVWTTSKYVDEMTDKISFNLTRDFQDQVGEGIFRYYPTLVVRIYPLGVSEETNKVLYNYDIILSTRDVLEGNKVTVAWRFNQEDAQVETWRASTDSKAAFCPQKKDHSFLKKLLESETLTLRWKNWVGEICTSKVNLTGFRAELNKAQEDYKTTCNPRIIPAPKPAEPDPPEEKVSPAEVEVRPEVEEKPKVKVRTLPKCNYCRGKGKVENWVGKTKKQQACPKCKGSGYIDK